MIQQCCGPTVVTGVECLLRKVDDPVDAAHRLDIPGRERLGRVGPQPGRVAVEPAHVALIDGLDVVAHRTVVTVRVPGPLEYRWHLEHFGDLDAGVTLVQQPQGLIVQICIQIALQGQELDDAVAPPGWPVVGGEYDVGAVGEGVDRLGEITGPGVRVAHHRAAQGQQVVQVVGRVLGHAQRAETREIEVHFGGRLGAGRHLELDLHAVDRVGFTGGFDVDGGDDDGDLAGGRRLAEPAADLTHWPARQQGAVHVGCPPRHSGPA